MTVDGIYGANTANAVIKYQRANGLSVDGIVGDETRNSIYRKKKEKEFYSAFIRKARNFLTEFFIRRRKCESAS